MTQGRVSQIAMVGFGEAATAFVDSWGPADSGPVAAYDIKLDAPQTRDAMLSHMAEHGAQSFDQLAEALASAAIVFSLVTADQALVAARQGAPLLARDTLWLDCNSCAPHTKCEAADVIEAAGGRYVDVAVMAPVHPKRHKTPLLLSGKHAATAKIELDRLGMNAEIAGERVGAASSIKMLRSVMIKGIEALTAECLLAASRAGVKDDVLASLQASDPQWDWQARSHYNLERMMLHGRRRAAEMREVAATVRALGLPDRMSTSIADWQDDIGALDVPGDADQLEQRIALILGAMEKKAT